jgi:hypothetical protein
MTLISSVDENSTTLCIRNKVFKAVTIFRDVMLRTLPLLSLCYDAELGARGGVVG